MGREDISMTISAVYEGVCYMIEINASHSNIITEIAKHPEQIADLTAHYEKQINGYGCANCDCCITLAQTESDFDPECVLGINRPGCYDCGACQY